MKTYSKENTKNLLKPAPFDLFGDVIVTQDELILWVDTITRGKYSGRNCEFYIKNWNVIAKIKRAKIDFGSLSAYFEAANDAIY